MANPNFSIAMATRLQSSSPNKRPKTLPSNPQSPTSSISKGKSKVEDPSPLIAEDESPNCCGICLSEAGFSRGQIECCDHYYCFVCIMEWAKVESKCPLCKRRFSTIRRPPKPPVFPCERVVRVPVRDQQVYYHTGNATTGPPNLYSEVKCSICEGITDESLLLLCDLCDSSAHTYCVGLGYTVPEGDWFCQDCTLLKDEQLKSESYIDADAQTGFSSVEKSPTYEHISILDIVRESHGHVAPLPSTNDVVTRNNIKLSSSMSLETIAQQPAKPNARNLRHCRNLHDRIRVLRQNWNGFRSGDYRFSSNRGEGSNSRKIWTCRSKEDAVSCSNKPSVAQCSSSGVKNDPRDHEIQKAWEMFDKAKLSNIFPHASKCPIGKLNPIRSTNCANNRQVSLDSQQNGANNAGSTGAVDPHRSFLKDCSEIPSSSSGKAMSKLHVAKDVTDCREGSIIGHSPAIQELRSSKENVSRLHNANIRSVRLRATETLKRQHCLESDVSGPVVTNIDEVKGVDHVSSSLNKVKHTKEKKESKKIYVDNQQYNDTKSEIQSLVKLNLKLQTKEEKLEVDAFKEIARLATHSILGACGLEDPRPPLCLIPGINICSHPNDIQKSSPMPSSCRECFYAFVKDVVDSVLLQKQRTHKNP